MSRLMTVDEAAEYLSLSPSTLKTRRWRLKLGIPAVKIGRRVLFDPHQLEVWLAAQPSDPKPAPDPKVAGA